MNTLTVLLLSVVVFCLTSLAIAQGESANDDEVKVQAKDQHHTHQKAAHQVHHRSHETAAHNQEKQHHSAGFYRQGRHHKGLKARDNHNTTTCISICDPELATIALWFNNTKELKLLYQIIPPSVKKAIFDSTNGTFGNVSVPNNSNTTFNGSISVNLDQLYDATVEWPILTYFAKLIGVFLSRTRGLSELFSVFPAFANLWKIILRGVSGGCSNPGVLFDNLKNLFGFNGTSAGNLFNFTYWEQFWSPARIIQTFEHAVEGGLQAIANASNLIG